MRHACFLTFPQTSVVPARLCGSAVNQSKELIWLSKQHCQVCMIYGLFPKCEWISEDNNCGKMCPYRYFLCRMRTCFMIRLKAQDLPFQSISDLCLHMLGRMGEFWLSKQLSRNSSLLLQEESRGCGDENSEEDPPHRFEKISWKILCSHK